MSSLLSMVWILLGLSLIHEDVAIVSAGFMVVEHGLPPFLAFFVLFFGSVVGDLCIYSLGRLARRIPWLRKKIIGPNVHRVHLWLNQHFVRVVCLSRVIPGVLFPSYVACGWFGFSFRRFVRIIILADAVYTALAFTIILTLGETVLKHVGYGVWGALAILLVLFTIVRTKNPRWGMIAAEPKHHPLAAIQGLLRRPSRRAEEPGDGLPPARLIKRKVAYAERIPPWLFYTPIGICWAGWAIRHRGAMLPCACNPNIETGGFWGESKSKVLDQIAPEQQRWVAKYVALKLSSNGTEDQAADFDRSIKAIQDAGLDFPLVVKPDIGWQGFGVRLVPDAESLRDYLEQYPAGETVIFQRYVPFDGEAGAFYARIPGEKTGRIVSLTLRYFAYVVGDGQSTLHVLIQQDERARFKSDTHLGKKPLHAGMDREDLERIPALKEVVRLAFIGSIRVGGLYQDARAEITPAMSARFDAIAQSMPAFHYGRFDIRFLSLDRLKEGEDFGIIEVNGAGAEAIHVWDPDLSLKEVYHSLFEALALMFRIGRLNRDLGYTPCSLWEFLTYARRQYKLILRYPPST